MGGQLRIGKEQDTKFGFADKAMPNVIYGNNVLYLAVFVVVSCGQQCVVFLVCEAKLQHTATTFESSSYAVSPTLVVSLGKWWVRCHKGRSKPLGTIVIASEEGMTGRSCWFC